jgi:hypothetical protein
VSYFDVAPYIIMEGAWYGIPCRQKGVDRVVYMAPRVTVLGTGLPARLALRDGGTRIRLDIVEGDLNLLCVPGFSLLRLFGLGLENIHKT